MSALWIVVLGETELILQPSPEAGIHDPLCVLEDFSQIVLPESVFLENALD